ncbi:MAG: outer membrane lipoprotein LolB [Proteobacteria bacterium]|nr:outer membrane lipoprotein LolB [Burkholderiales bacterium]
MTRWRDGGLSLPAPVRPDRYPLRFLASMLASITLVCTGCASLPATGRPQPVTAIEGDPAFELSGRLALRQAEQALSANLRWRYEGAIEEMVITGPLGAGSAELVRDPGGVVFRSQGRELRARDAQALMREALGFALPLDGLRYWVRGQLGPADLAVRVERDARGRLVSFHESGWEVTITDYGAAPIDALPRRLDVQSSDLQARLVIDQWLRTPLTLPSDTPPDPPAASSARTTADPRGAAK